MGSFEYKEMRVPLNVSGKTRAGPGITKDMAVRKAAIGAAPSVTEKILSAVQAEGPSGWEPDEAIDLPSLLLADQVGWRVTGGILFSWKFTFDFATIRFRRSISFVPSGTAPKRFCAQCGSPGEERAHFCANCGAAL